MPVTSIPFGQDAAMRLAKLGLKISSAYRPLRLNDQSWFEGPTAVQTVLTDASLIQVGAFSSLAGGNMGNVRIGRYTSIADGLTLGAHEHPVDWLTSSRVSHYPQMHDWHVFMSKGDPAAGDRLAGSLRRPYASSCPITEIGNDVWIGQGVFVKAGVRIGDGAIVGARSVVVKDVEPYTVVIGAPAKARKLRFPEALVERLRAARWWRYSLFDLAGVTFENVPAALDAIEERVARGELKEYAAPRHTAEDLRRLFS